MLLRSTSVMLLTAYQTPNQRSVGHTLNLNIKPWLVRWCSKKMVRHMCRKFSLSIVIASNRNRRFGKNHMNHRCLYKTHFCKQKLSDITKQVANNHDNIGYLSQAIANIANFNFSENRSMKFYMASVQLP